ncbi:MAG: hypothetical protein L3J24_02275 [Xanthomonadales bacterium]|nr:hypothetical protein [Xanthomonadales bacterium]
MHLKNSNSILDTQLTLRQALNAARYQQASKTGHYESYFLRANHPKKPLAFWFRYSIFSPSESTRSNTRVDIGELWAVVFNRETNRMTAVKEEFQLDKCSFSASGLDVTIADQGYLLPDMACGNISKDGSNIRWDLKYTAGQIPMRLLPEYLYKGKFPTAKTAVPNPMAVFTGQLEVNGETYEIDNWIGSQNHNWGRRLIDEYAWGQVAGFDNDPDVFLECATARVKLGPFQTPWLTTLILRFDDREIKISSFWRAYRAKAAYKSFNWDFDISKNGLRVQGSIEAPLESFIGFNYYKPDGGSRTCLNTKIAKCQLLVTEPGKADRVFKTRHRAAFEIFNSDKDHGVLVIA